MQSNHAFDERFANAVETIYDAAIHPASWPRALQAIADVFDDVGAVLLWRRDDGGYGTIVSPQLVEAQNRYQDRWWREDIRSVRGVERGFTASHDAITDRDVVTDEEMATHPIYTEFLIPAGLGWFAGCGISPDPSVQVWCTVQRTRAKQPYSKSELEAVARLGRYAEKSLRLSIRLLDAELSKQGLADALARLGIGVFALDRLGHVMFSNPAGQRLIGGNVDVTDGRLNIGAGAERVAIQARIRQLLNGERSAVMEDPKPTLVRRSSGDRPLIVYFLPLGAQENPAEQFLTHTRAIVLVIDPKYSDPPDPAVVRDLLGLTLGEARVASLVGFGLPPREAAQRLGLTEESVRTVLKRVFAKAGVSRQSELSAMLTKLVLR